MLSDLSIPPNLVGHLTGYLTISISNIVYQSENHKTHYVCFKLWGSEELQIIDILTQNISIPSQLASNISFQIRTSKELIKKYLYDMDTIIFYTFLRETNINILKEGDLSSSNSYCKINLKDFNYNNDIWYSSSVQLIDSNLIPQGSMEIKFEFNSELPVYNMKKELIMNRDTMLSPIKKESKPILIENKTIYDNPNQPSFEVDYSKTNIVSDIISRAKKLKININNSLKNDFEKNVFAEDHNNSIKYKNSSQGENISKITETYNSPLIESSNNSFTKINFEINSIEFDIKALNQLNLKGKTISTLSCHGKYGLPILDGEDFSKAKYSSIFSLPSKDFKKNSSKPIIFENVSTFSFQDRLLESSKFGALINMSLNIKTNFLESPIQCSSFCLNSLISSPIFIKGTPKLLVFI